MNGPSIVEWNVAAALVLAAISALCGFHDIWKKDTSGSCLFYACYCVTSSLMAALIGNQASVSVDLFGLAVLATLAGTCIGLLATCMYVSAHDIVGATVNMLITTLTLTVGIQSLVYALRNSHSRVPEMYQNMDIALLYTDGVVAVLLVAAAIYAAAKSRRKAGMSADK